MREREGERGKRKIRKMNKKKKKEKEKKRKKKKRKKKEEEEEEEKKLTSSLISTRKALIVTPYRPGLTRVKGHTAVQDVYHTITYIPMEMSEIVLRTRRPGLWERLLRMRMALS